MGRNYRSMKGNGEMWDPKKDADGKDLQPSENSKIEGYYVGCETGQGKDNNSTVHKIIEEESGAEKSFWGSFVLDEQLSKIVPGSFIMVKWLGLTQPKTKTGRPYHDWEVFVDSNEAPLDVKNPLATPKNESQGQASRTAEPGKKEPVAQTASAESVMEEEDDDLPF